MDALASAVAVNQAMTQQQLGLLIVKQAIESQQQLIGLLSEAVQSGQLASGNPAHLGQSIDTFA